MHVAILTAGGAGMFCGSCMHDNTWARALRAAGTEISLIPTYTPIRVDDAANISDRHVFLGGVNLYLEYKWRWWRRLPRPLTRWLDAPGLINWLSGFGVSNDARELGELTLSLLSGERGPHVREIDELARFLADLSPDVICFSNALLVGSLRRVRERTDARIYCTLQGDDIFLDQLPQPFRGQALAAMQERVQDFDGFLVHSRYYRDLMAECLNVPADRFSQIPLGIDLQGHVGRAEDPRPDPFTVGYFARICPEKGLHRLVEAFLKLHAREPNTRLVAAGWLSKEHRGYLNDVRQLARPLGEAFEYRGSPETLAEKVALLREFHVLSVPTVYREPKGLYVLEALANGVPVVQPAHGAFPELLETTSGGLLVAPDNPGQLADALQSLMRNPHRRIELGRMGWNGVRARLSPEVMARETLAVFSEEADGVPVGSG